MNKHQSIALSGTFILALILGFLGAYLYNSATNTTYAVELANGCARQPNGKIVNTVVAGPTLDIHVANKNASELASFALSRGICLDKK